MAVRDVASLLVGLLVLCHTGGVRADVEVNMEDRVEVLRGKTARITCMFKSSEGIGGLLINWSYVTRSGEKQLIYYQDSTVSSVERGTQFTDRISVNGTTGEIVLTIDKVLLADELEYICLIKTVTGAVSEGRTKLKVFEIPDIPVIEGVQTGISVNENDLSKIATCEVKNGFPKPNITWYRNNTPLRNVQNEVKIVPSITTESSGLFSVKSELSMKVMKKDKDDFFYCEVNYFVPGETRMTESTRINITVYYPSTAVSVWVESPKGKIKEGDSIELHCSGNGNAPSSIISIKHIITDESWETNRLVLSNVSRLNSGVYECTSMDTEDIYFDEISGNTTVTVNYLDPPAVIPKDAVVMRQGEELEATCNALSSLQTQTTWFKKGKEVSKGHKLMLKDATFDTAGTYVCVVTVPEIEGMETSQTLIVHVQGMPEIVKPDTTEIEATFETTVDLSCDVRGFPAPRVTWTSDGKVLQAASQKEIEKGIQSVVSIKVTSDITALCRATNSYGTDELAFNIKATTHTTTPATTITTTTTTTTATSSSSTTISSTTEGRGVIIAVIIICILLLAILGSVLYFLYKKGKICGRSGKKDITKEKSNKDNIVVEMKSDNLEDAELLGANGEKQPQSDQ
uniref:melanoma cell adhesion molecule b isoform X2 n=1 Tax=Scatophagus argus TaxID=75038 RepID=UPI001ED8111E|nr:melanoma cell adhesion molecule b isoform X2 [Scatophagus argus]